MPFEIDVVERRIRQLEIERAALAKETDDASQRGSTRSKPSCVAARGARRHGRALADREGRHRRDPEARSGSRQARLEAERAERDGDLERAAQLRYGHIPVLEREIEAMSDALDELQTRRRAC